MGGVFPHSPPTPLNGHFCKSSKTAEKILGWVWVVTSSPILEFQAELVTSGFQRPGSNLYFIQF